MGIKLYIYGDFYRFLRPFYWVYACTAITLQNIYFYGCNFTNFTALKMGKIH